MKNNVRPEDIEDSYRVPLVAKMFGVSPQTIRQWIYEKKVRAIRPPSGRPYYIPREEVERLLSNYRFTKPTKRRGEKHAKTKEGEQGEAEGAV